MVNIDFDLKDVAEIKIGKRTFKAGKLEEANVGDFLLFVGAPFEYLSPGRLYSIREVLSKGGVVIKDDDGDDFVVERDDDEFILMKPDLTERDKEFFRLGRLPDQFKVGDIVQVTEYSCGFQVGTIGVIKEIDDEARRVVSNGIREFYESHIRLIAPVEHTNPVK